MYYNSKTRQVISVPPWGKSYVSDEVKSQDYADWQEVDDDFIPPTPTLTKEEQCLQISADYKPQFDELASAFVTAIITGNATLQTSNKTRYTALKQELAAKIGGVMNG